MDQEQNNTEGPEAPENTAANGDQGAQEKRSEAEAQFAEMKQEAEGDGVSEHKTFAIVGYILPILFFIPLLNEKSKHNAFAKFHANQQLILLIALIGLYILHNIFFMMFMFGGYFLMQLVNLAFLVFVIIGVINAAKGEMKELPLIGGFQLLK